MFFNFFTLVLLLAVVVECAPGKKGKKDKNKRVFDLRFNNRLLPLPLIHLLLIEHESLLSMKV
jgi:hypothetical protein